MSGFTALEISDAGRFRDYHMSSSSAKTRIFKINIAIKEHGIEQM